MTASSMAQGHASFLRLPVELRLRVYDELLLRRTKAHASYDFSEFPVKKVFKHFRDPIPLYDLSTVPSDWTPPPEVGRPLSGIHPAVLRVCKQCYTEGHQILYRENSFLGRKPSFVNNVFDKLGDANLRLVRDVHLNVELFDSDRLEISDWTKVLKRFATGLTTLRKLHVRFAIKDVVQATRSVSAEADQHTVEVLRSLARIQQLTKLEVRGYYATHWVEYLQRSLPHTEVTAAPMPWDLIAGPVLEETYGAWLAKRLDSDFKTLALKGLLGRLDEHGDRVGSGGCIYWGDLPGQIELEYLELVARADDMLWKDREAKWREDKARWTEYWRAKVGKDGLWAQFQRRVEHLVP